MSKKSSKEDYLERWISLIQTNNFKRVMAEVQGSNLSAKNALAFIVKISQLAYNDVQNGEKFKISLNDVVRLTEELCQAVNSEPSLCNVRYLTSLYHITHFLYKENQPELVARIFKIIVRIKEVNLKIFESNEHSLQDHFISLLIKTITSLSSDEKKVPVNIKNVLSYLSLLMDVMVLNNTLERGEVFLKCVLHTCQTIGSKDKRLGVRVISTGLFLFYKVETVKDVESSLKIIFKLYSCLFSNQLEISDYHSALCTIESHINEIKFKFSEKTEHEQCLLILYNTVKVFAWDCSEASTVLRKIQEVNDILKEFQVQKPSNLVLTACCTLVTMVLNSHISLDIAKKVIHDCCMVPAMKMLLNIFCILKNLNGDKLYLIYSLSECFSLLSDYLKGESDKEVVEECIFLVEEAETHIIEVLQPMELESHSKLTYIVNIILARVANLIRQFYSASLLAKVITIAEPLLKFICTSVPSNVFEDYNDQVALEVCFTYLVSALGTKQLNKGLHCIVAWLLLFPQSSKKAFKVWGDIKHNAVCNEDTQDLETTVYSILVEGKSSFEEEWLPCTMSSDELGKYLLQELKTYLLNKVLRGGPVIAAAEGLLSLKTDIVTQARGLTIAIDVASASEKFPEQCKTYFDRSKHLVTQLHNQKKTLDVVDFNCCMGNLLYAQLRCQLRYLRMDCESEVLRLSVAPAQPLIEELPENRPDPNDTCDVATKYSNLSFAKQCEFVNKLDSVLKHWGIAYAKLLEQNNTDYDLMITLENLQDAGFLLKLYGDEIRQGQTWNLLYKMALLTKNVDKIVTAAGEMLLINTKNIDHDSIDSAKQKLKSSELSEKVKFAFTLNMSLYQLNNSEISEGLKILDSTECEIKKSTLLFVTFLSVIGRYQKLSDWFKYNHTFKFSPSYHFSYQKALSYLLYLAEEQKWNSFSEATQIQQLLLYVSHQLGDINWCLQQPREARCYLKSQLSLAQKLALPLRAVQLLLVLAWVDLYTGVMDDCEVKLNGLEDLLGLEGALTLYVADGSPNKPSIGKSKLHEPEYLSHSPGCACLPCSCLEYKRLILEVVTLRATYSANCNLITHAEQSFDVGFKVQEDLSLVEDDIVRLSCSRFWMHYANFMGLTNKFHEGLTANKKALELLPSNQDPNTYQRLVDQKFSLLTCTTEKPYKPIRARISFEDEESKPVVKTPSVVKTKIPVAVRTKTPLSANSGNVTPTFVRPVKRLILPSSGEENTPPPIPKSRRRPKTLPKFVSDTPQTNRKPQNETKTPFVIFDDEKANIKSSPKVCSTLKKRAEKKLVESNGITKKKLFEYDNSLKKTDVKSSHNYGEPDDIVIMCKRRQKTYGKGKTKNLVKIVQEEKQDDDVFSFDKLKKEVDKINGVKLSSVCVNPGGSTFQSQLGNQIGDNSCNTHDNLTTNVNCKDDSDVDFVEGTPEQKQRRVLRKFTRKQTTRSNKP